MAFSAQAQNHSSRRPLLRERTERVRPVNVPNVTPDRVRTAAPSRQALLCDP